MPDWATISSFATACGTLGLGVATFSSVRSGNRVARTAERALQVGLRPVLFPSRLDDPAQKIRWGDTHWASLRGSGAIIGDVDGVVYLAMSLRNVGSGIAVIHGWRVSTEEASAGLSHPDPDTFRPQSRDLYVPAGDTSFWQAAIRAADDPDRDAVLVAVARGGLSIDVLYGDHEGGQRTASRFAVHPRGEGGEWICSVVRHWNIDRPDPR